MPTCKLEQRLLVTTSKSTYCSYGLGKYPRSTYNTCADKVGENLPVPANLGIVVSHGFCSGGVK